MYYFFIYILKSTFCLTIFYLAYKVLLSNETFFRFNRKILLSGMVVCLFLPFIKIDIPTPPAIQESLVYFQYVFTDQPQQLQEETLLLPVREVNQATHSSYSYRDIYIGLYVLGVAVSFFLLLQSLWSVINLIRKGKQIKREKQILVLSGKNFPPFNWWKYILLPEEEYKRLPEEVIIHEMAHSHRCHSLDLLFMEILLLFHWFNPVVWLLKKELRDLHEYEADSEVLIHGIDATRYQLLLVKKAVGSSSYTLANSFNQSKLKKRITMMCKKETNKWNRWKAILILPAMAGTLYAFASPAMNRTLQEVVRDEGTTISPQEEEVNTEFFEKAFQKWFKGEEKDPSILAAGKLYVIYNRQTVPLFINAHNRIMYNGKYYEDENQLASLISADLEKSERPFSIYFQVDTKTSSEVRERVYQIIRNTFADNVEKKDAMVLYRDKDKKDVWCAQSFTTQRKEY